MTTTFFNVPFQSLIRTFVVAVGLAVAAGLPTWAHAQAAGDTAMLTVTGQGEVFAQADVAYVTLGVSEQDASAARATDRMSRAAAQILERLQTSGIDMVDIQTGQLSLERIYDPSSYNGTPTVTGFEATTMLTVRVRDLGSLGEVLDAVVKDGANRLGGVRFDVLNPEPLLNAARRAAVADARAKATLFADAAGVELGDLIRLEEQGAGLRPQPMLEMRMMADSSSIPVAGGEVSLQASVTLVYAIAD